MLKPWKETLKLLKEHPDFARFQIGFMLGGASLMVAQPIIPIFFVDVLNLSYTKMLLALAVCKSLGYAAASPFWVRYFERTTIYRFSGVVILLGALFPLCLILSSAYPLLVYAAYLLYGAMQTGSELSWHMSGPVFANEKESSRYSTVNVLSVGVRGCIAPPLGSLLFALTGPTSVLAAGACLSLISAWAFLKHSKDSKAAQSY